MPSRARRCSIAGRLPEPRAPAPSTLTVPLSEFRHNLSAADTRIHPHQELPVLLIHTNAYRIFWRPAAFPGVLTASINTVTDRFISSSRVRLPNMDSQTQCLLLHDLPELSLSLIWQHVCKLPMADRRALLATCKKALSTFGGHVDRMARLELTMKQVRIRATAEPIKPPCSDGGGSSSSRVTVQTSNSQARTAPELRGSSSSSLVAKWTSNAPQAPQKQQRGSFRTALLVLSCFQRARLERLDLHFRDSPGLMLSPALADFFLSSRGTLEHVTCLEMNCKEVSEPSRVELHEGASTFSWDKLPGMRVFLFG